MNSIIQNWPATMDSRIQGISEHLLALTEVTEFDPRRIARPLMKHLFILKIDSDPETARLRFRIHFTGTAIDHRFNRDIKGTFIDNYEHGPHNLSVLNGFVRCAKERESVWMRQVFKMSPVSARYVEGIAHFLEPDRIYGGLVTGDIVRPHQSKLSIADRFDIASLTRDCSARLPTP